MKVFKKRLFWLILISLVAVITMLPILIKPQFGLTDNGIAYVAAKSELHQAKSVLGVFVAWLSGERFEEIGRYRPLYFGEIALQCRLFDKDPLGYWLWLLIKIILILMLLFLIINQLIQDYFLSFVFSGLLFTFPTYRCQVSTYETQEPLQAVFVLGIIFLALKMLKGMPKSFTIFKKCMYLLGLSFLLLGAYFYKETTLSFLPVFLLLAAYLIFNYKQYFMGIFFAIANLTCACVVLVCKPSPNINASAQDYVNGMGLANIPYVFTNKLLNVFSENPIITFVLCVFLFLLLAEYFEWLRAKKFKNFVETDNFFMLFIVFATLCNVAFLSLWARGDHPKYDLLRASFSCILLAYGFKRFVLFDFGCCNKFKMSFCCVAVFFVGLQGFQNLKNIYRDYLWIQRDREMIIFLAKNTEPEAKIYQNFLAYEQTVETLLQLKHFYLRSDIHFYNALPVNCPPYGDINYTNEHFLDEKDSFDYVIIDKAWNRFKKPDKPIGVNYGVAFENKNWIILRRL